MCEIEQTVEGINLKRVEEPAKSLDIQRAVEIIAVLCIHNALPKDNNGVATITIRQLLAKFLPGLDPLLREYVCSFGTHGVTLLNRYITNTYNLPGIQNDVNNRLADTIKRFSAQL